MAVNAPTTIHVPWLFHFNAFVAIYVWIVSLTFRVDVVLQDPSREVQHYVDRWRMFLPSDVLLVAYMVSSFCNLEFAMFYLYLRFSSMYNYDWQLFKARFIGPDGVPCAKCYVW